MLNHKPHMLEGPFARGQMTNLQRVSTVLRVRKPSNDRKPKNWPYAQFNADLDAWMAAQEIPDRTTLARLAGIEPSLPSNWLYGYSKPSRASLRKIAPILGVDVRHLEVSAGLANPAEVGLAEGEQAEPTPRQLRVLIEHYNNADEGLRMQLLQRVEWVNEWVELTKANQAK